MPKTPKVNMTELKSEFNDKVMRELGIDYDDTQRIYWMDTDELIMLNEKYIKYSEEEYPILGHDEIELNLLENPRLMETLAFSYLSRRVYNEIKSLIQDTIKGSNKGHCIVSYTRKNSDGNDEIAQIVSDPFINESVRVFNLICKINVTDHLYDFKKYDIEITKRK